MLDGKLRRELEGIFGPEGVLTEPQDLIVYEYDASLSRALPDAVVFPTSREQVSAVARLAHREGIPLVARGSGTSFSGGSIPVRGGITLAFNRMNKILKLEPENRLALVEPGVINLSLSEAAEPLGFFYAPDPASQKVCTLGGNFAENSGGPHCIKYGVTTNHMLGAEVVLADGEVLWVGGKALDWPGYDLMGVLVGSEGTLAIATKLICRLLPLPESVRTMMATFREVEDAGRAVSAIIASGIIPATLELMNKVVMRAVEQNIPEPYPSEAGAVLIIEVDGLPSGMDSQVAKITALCEEKGALGVEVAQSLEDRERLWAGRRESLGAMARIGNSYYVVDGTVPRTRLPEVIREIDQLAQERGLIVGNVLHAGDGNLHPTVVFNGLDPGERERALEACTDILAICARAQGTITGEHGIGIEKRANMHLIFSPTDLTIMHRVKEAFDPKGVLNPEKIFPEEPSPVGPPS